MRGSGRRTLALSLAVGLIGLVGPSSAGGAVTIGQTGNPTNSCPPNTNLVQAAAAEPFTYAVPPGFGVVTSWSFQGFSPTAGTGKLIMWRPAGGFQFQVVGKSDAETFTPGLATIYQTRIAVEPGDVLGMRAVSSPSGDVPCLGGGAASGNQLVFSSTASEPETGSTQTVSGGPFTNRVLVAATLEPDCDADGFGDETQDPDTSSCDPPAPKADGTLTIDANKAKVEKGRKVTLTGQYDTPTNEACEPNRTIEIQRRKKSQPDTAFATFESVQTDAAGNYTTKEKVKKTYFYRAVVTETEVCDDETSNSQKVRVKQKKAAQEA